jgi:putative ABC transport system substrate-binding protein
MSITRPPKVGMRLVKRIGLKKAKVAFARMEPSLDAENRRWPEPYLLPVRSEDDIEGVLSDLGREPGGGLVVVPDNFITGRTPLMVSLLARYRLPAVRPYPYFPTGGGLMCYGVDPLDNFRKLPTYVDRVLRGEHPQNLAVQLPTTFRLIINMKTANTLGLTVPSSLLARADEVIE